MPKISQTFVIEGDVVKCLYNEAQDVDVRKLGDIVRAEKISDVRFDTKTQTWIAVDRKTGKTIARDRSRKKCVEKEHAFYEGMIAAGKPPWSARTKCR